MPTTQAFTRTLGPHSTARVCVRLSRPPLAPPYPPVPGDGRRPLRLQMLTIDPPFGWFCIVSLACWETDSAPSRLSSMILRLNFALDSAVKTKGEPPALLTTTSRRPCLSTIASTIALTASSSRMSQGWNSTGRPSIARRAQVTTVAPCWAKTPLIPAPTPRTPPVTSTTRPLSPKLNAGPPSAWVTVLAYQASACLGNRPPKEVVEDLDDYYVAHRRTGDSRGHRRLSPCQCHPVTRLVRTRRGADRRRQRSDHSRGNPARRGPRIQRGRRHQGDAAHRGLHRAHRRQPRLLRRLPCGLRVRGPGDRRGQRILRRRRHRPGRQRRRDRGLRGCDIRAAGGRARRAGRGDPPVPIGAAAHDAAAVLHGSHCRCRHPAPLRFRARSSAARGTRRSRPAGGARYRHQGHSRHPRG